MYDDLTPRAVGYWRASTDEQYLSPEDQCARIEAWCTAYEHDLIMCVGDHVSGNVPLADREEGRKIEALIEARHGRGRLPDFDVLVVTRLDRLTRDLEDGTALLKRFTPKKYRRHPLPTLVALDEHIDLSTAFGRFTANLRLLFGQFERELIGERTSAALQHKRRNGRAAAVPPYGWDKAEDGALVRNEHEQAVIADMSRWHAAGVNDNVIAARLNERGSPTKRGKTWHANTVHRILKAQEASS
jgi:DNA invertase Pin-like site-specific DNA recombinase